MQRNPERSGCCRVMDLAVVVTYPLPGRHRDDARRWSSYLGTSLGIASIDRLAAAVSRLIAPDRPLGRMIARDGSWTG